MTTSNNNSNALTNEQLLNALDSEIAYIKSEQQRPGWTIWAMLGALAVIVWHLLFAWENGFSTTINVFSWFLTFALLADAIIAFNYSVSSEGSQHKYGSRYYFFQQRYSEERPAILLSAIYYIILIRIVIELNTAVKWYYSYPAYLYCGLLMLLTIAVLVLSYVKLPVPKSELTWYARIILLVLSLMAFLPAIGYLSYLTLNFKSVRFADMRLGILFWAACFLLIKLTQLGKKSALLLSLIEIRRDLAFRRIDVKFAQESADIALAGMRLTNVVQGNVHELIKLLEKMDDEARIIGTRYDMALSKLPTKKATLTGKRKELISAVIDSCKEHIEKEKELINQYNEKLKPFGKRLFRLSSKKDPEFNEILDKIKVARKETEKMIDENNKKLDKLKKGLK